VTRIDENGEVQANKHAWHQVCDVLFVDQPVGTGLSRRGRVPDLATYDSTAEKLLRFLGRFYESKASYPRIVLAGESLAGKVLVRLALLLHRRADERISSELAGLFLVSPWIDAISLYSNSVEFLRLKGLFTSAELDTLQQLVNECVGRISVPLSELPVEACDFCFSVYDKVFEKGIYKYHVQYPKTNNLYTQLSRQVQLSVVAGASRLLNYFGDTSAFRTSSLQTSSLYKRENHIDDSRLLRQVVQSGIETHVMLGQEDFITNYLGSLASVAGFAAVSAPRDAADHLTYETSFPNLRLTVVRGAGHFVCWHASSLCQAALRALASTPQ